MRNMKNRLMMAMAGLANVFGVSKPARIARDEDYKDTPKPREYYVPPSRIRSRNIMDNKKAVQSCKVMRDRLGRLA